MKSSRQCHSNTVKWKRASSAGRPIANWAKLRTKCPVSEQIYRVAAVDERTDKRHIYITNWRATPLWSATVHRVVYDAATTDGWFYLHGWFFIVTFRHVVFYAIHIFIYLTFDDYVTWCGILNMLSLEENLALKRNSRKFHI